MQLCLAGYGLSDGPSVATLWGRTLERRSSRVQRRRVVALCVLASVVVAGCDWMQFRFGPSHPGASGDSAISSLAVPGLIAKWSGATGGAVESSPAVVKGTVYVGSNDQKLYAFDAKTGALQWAALLGGAVMSSPAVVGSTVYVGADDHRLYARKITDGSNLWSVAVDGSFGGLSSAPTVSGDVVYVSSVGKLYAFNLSDGSPRWSLAVPASGALSAPSIGDGRVYVASYADASVFAYDAGTGAPAWSTTAPGTRSSCPSSLSSPAVVGGIAYVALCPSTGTPKQSLFALRDDTGAILWSAGNAVNTTSPAVTSGVVYVGAAGDHTLEGHSASDGSLQWTATLGGAVVSSPAVVGGVVYVGSDDSNLYGFDATGKTNCNGTPKVCAPLWTETTGGPVPSSPAVVDGFVYVGSDDHQLHAYGFPPISFGKSVLGGTSSTKPTVARLGPDGRLYVAQFDGVIKAYTIARAGVNTYNVTNTETIGLVQQIPNHDDDGSLNTSVNTRLITGLLVTGSSTSPVIYAASSDPRVGGGGQGIITNLDTNSGVISRVSRNGTGGWQRLDLVRGLPRSEEQHATNTLVLDASTNTLYAAQGGNTNEGAPSHNFNFLPEYAYSAAILKINLTAIGNATYDLPTLTDENNPNLVRPFGGDFGKHQAKITTSSPVQIYAPGFRNPFAMVKTRAGKLYAIDNGPNAGWGDIPINAGTHGQCTNAVNEPGVHDNDSLHLVTNGYYGGHANPTRGNRANTFNTTNPQSPVPVADPIECDARFATNNGSIARLAAGTAGMAEYTTANLADQLDGNLIVAGFATHNVSRVPLTNAGTKAGTTDVLFSNAGTNPIDVVVEGESDPLPGVVFVPDFSDGTIYVFEPADFGGRTPPPCSGAYSTTLDEDHDGYTNADEIDNGTDPCSAADAPHDWNRNFISDRNDPDDDGDGLPDISDPFAIDPNNGLTTNVPTSYNWQNGATNNPCAPTPFPSGCPGGLLGLGFTGLMTNGQTNYANLYNPSNIIAGGAAGVLTVASVPAGDATGTTNTQQYAFQFGVNASPTSTGVFTAHTRIVGPFAGITPAGNDSMGLYIGTGDQDNYAKLVLTANGGSPGIQLVKEVGATPTPGPFASMTLPGPDAVDLYLTVDPAAATVTAAYRVTSNGTPGPITTLGSPQPIPTPWLNNTKRGLALGTIATSAGGSPFPATWSVLEATLGTPG